jgi:hypothetical protein
MRGDYSLADIATATGNGNGGFGGDNWSWIIVLFLIFGWGRNGFGGGFGGSGVGENYVLATDFATIERKLDAVNSGICDATFALNNTITNGFAGVQNTLCQGFNGLNIAYLQGTNTLSSQLADCCCTTQRAIDGVNYNMATNSCAITNAINNATRDIVDSQNANYRALHDEIVANRIEDKNAQIQAQQNEINALRLSASQAKQNAYLLNELKPCPSAAYIVPNPNCCYDYTVTRNTCCNF